MALPNGIQTSTLTFGTDLDFGGNPLAVAVTVTPSIDIVWKATGQRIAGPSFPQRSTASAGFPGSISVPVTDQVGFADGLGNDVTSWFYTVSVTYTGQGGGSETITKTWSPLTGQTTVDFDLIPSGSPQPALTSPTVGVTSFNGQTGAVTYAGGGTSLTDNNNGTFTGGTVTGYTKAGADSTFAAGRPWEFRPETYGAHGDGKLARDITTNGTNTFTSPTIAANGAVGMWVMINGGRGTTGDTAAIGTITTISGNNITIDTTARSLPITASAANLDALFGTDDVAAINATFAAGKAYAEAHDYYFKVVFQDRIYMACALTQSSDGNITYNTQIPIPRPTDNNGRKLVIELEGVGPATHNNYWNSTTADLAGTVIATTQFGPNTIDATYGIQSVFGAGIPASNGNMAGSTTPVFVNHKPIFRNIQVAAPVYTNVTAFDWRYSGGVGWNGVSAFAFASAIYGTGVRLNSEFATTTFASKNGCGFRLPTVGNNADSVGGDMTVAGFAIGLSTPSEHVTIGTYKAVFVGVVLQITNSTTGHGLVIGRVTAEDYQGGIQNNVTNQPGKVPVFISLWNTEGNAANGGYDINDPSNTLTGEIHYSNTVDSGGQFPVVIGGGNCRIICESVYRGAQTPPTVPATTVAKQNPFWKDAIVRITGGTVTSVVVDGQTVATATGVTVTVPTGKSITLTYSSAPTWTWNLL